MKNSTIFKNPEDAHLFDLSYLGVRFHENKKIEINQPNHFFQVGDALFYNIKTKLFEKALAKNSIESEVCGVVSEIESLDDFALITSGEIKTTRYQFPVNTELYLSDAQPGKLVSIYPSEIVKQIATQSTNGIIVNIQRGLKTTATSDPETYEPYTKEDLDEIIQNIW